MTVFEKFAANPLVLSHYFIGLLALLIFLVQQVITPGSSVHRLLGRSYVLVYLVMVALGLFAGLLFDFYQDPSLSWMLWGQSVFSITLILWAWHLAARATGLHAALPVILLSASSLVVMARGLIAQQSISTGFGCTMLMITVWIVGKGRNETPRILLHSFLMSISGLLLAFNATGFFGIHRILDDVGEVSWGRAVASFAAFLFLVLLADGWTRWRVRSTRTERRS